MIKKPGLPLRHLVGKTDMKRNNYLTVLMKKKKQAKTRGRNAKHFPKHLCLECVPYSVQLLN